MIKKRREHSSTGDLALSRAQRILEIDPKQRKPKKPRNLRIMKNMEKEDDNVEEKKEGTRSFTLNYGFILSKSSCCEHWEENPSSPPQIQHQRGNIESLPSCLSSPLNNLDGSPSSLLLFLFLFSFSIFFL